MTALIFFQQGKSMPKPAILERPSFSCLRASAANASGVATSGANAFGVRGYQFAWERYDRLHNGRAIAFSTGNKGSSGVLSR